MRLKEAGHIIRSCKTSTGTDIVRILTNLMGIMRIYNLMLLVRQEYRCSYNVDNM